MTNYLQADGKKIGGEFKREKNPGFLADRCAVFDRIQAAHDARQAALSREPIKVTMPDGTVRDEVGWETTPMSIAKSISKKLAKSAIVARVWYTRRLALDADIVNPEDEDEDDEPETAVASRATAAGAGAGDGVDGEESKDEGTLWDMTRPLEGDCRIEIKTFDDPDGKTVFWHSSAHVLGQAMETELGGKLCIGPPTKDGFYYDVYVGDSALGDSDRAQISKAAKAICNPKQAQSFHRLLLTKDEALEMLADNPFKVALISNKIPDGGFTTVYRCGSLIDLCMGPHIPSTSLIKSFEILGNSAAYWLGQQTNDSLQRVYAVSFPTPAQMKKHLRNLEEAKKRDHRKLGEKHQLFFFHTLSPGSCFFLPNGAHIYNKLMDFIKGQYRARGYKEVITPNVFNLDLWKISGHADHYLENMFTFDVEGAKFGLKPMNCPGHCLMFDHNVRSHRELPIRFADFGVLHRNELSGALTGLTRVRRFQQDDAHIFCTLAQVKDEVAGVLDFMRFCYRVFGFRYELMLSTRPKKALGSVDLWHKAESALADALEDFGEPWAINKGDGAFYGPKIDIRVFDALERPHQCATIQLDFQLPIRFKLRYKAADEAVTEDGLPAGFARPVMVHRAILGSVERMMAVLIEHTNADWPLWLSPRQVCIVPVAQDNIPYGREVKEALHAKGFQVAIDDSTKTLNKKVREAQVARYNYVFVLGNKESTDRTVTIRSRAGKQLGTLSIEAAAEMLHAEVATYGLNDGAMGTVAGEEDVVADDA